MVYLPTSFYLPISLSRCEMHREHVPYPFYTHILSFYIERIPPFLFTEWISFLTYRGRCGSSQATSWHSHGRQHGEGFLFEGEINIYRLNFLSLFRPQHRKGEWKRCEEWCATTKYAVLQKRMPVILAQHGVARSRDVTTITISATLRLMLNNSSNMYVLFSVYYDDGVMIAI